MKDLIADISVFSLSNFDLFMLGIIGASVIFGLIRGCIKSFISAAGWVLSMAIGMKFYFLLEPLISKYITLSVVAAVVAGITLFFISAIIIAILNNILYLALNSLCGGLLDRSLGLLFGFIRGCLLVSLIFYILLMTMPQLSITSEDTPSSDYYAPVPSWAKKSESILLLNKGAAFIDKMIPIDFKRKLKKMLSGGEPFEHETTKHENVKHPFTTKKRGKDSVFMILRFLPKDVVNQISQDDLILLQDKSARFKDKIRILENISKEYQQYIEEEDTEDLTEDELNKRDLKYYKHMSIIENQIIEYGG